MHKEYTIQDFLDGKTKKEQLVGIKYPDGTVQWFEAEDTMAKHNVTTSEGRQKAQKDYESDCRRLHTVAGKLIFLARTRTTKYSEPEVLG